MDTSGPAASASAPRTGGVRLWGAGAGAGVRAGGGLVQLGPCGDPGADLAWGDAGENNREPAPEPGTGEVRKDFPAAVASIPVQVWEYVGGEGCGGIGRYGGWGGAG